MKSKYLRIFSDYFPAFTMFIVMFLTPDFAIAYNGPEHHRHMGVRAADESNLDIYLKDNLGFSRGINTTLTNPRVLGSKR